MLNQSAQYEDSKVLSICMCGRDDDYMPDFQYRITTTINHFARSLKRLGRLNNVEILITDWGSQIPMSKSLNLSLEAAEITHFIYVPIELIRATQEGKEDFHNSRAPNVSIRRANGKFIMFYNADTLFPHNFLEILLRFLTDEMNLNLNKERTFFLVPRYDVPWQFLERKPDLDDWDRYFLLNVKNKILEPTPIYAYIGSAGALMMHRSMWHNLRGLDENLAGWGWNDFDLGLRASQNHPIISLSSIGIFLYHMGHPPSGKRQESIEKGNMPKFDLKYQLNDDNWGFGNIHKLDIQHAQKIFNIKMDQDGNECLPNKTLADIISGLEKSETIDQVKSVVNSFFMKGGDIGLDELKPLIFLSWYSLHHFPRSYFEFTTERTLAAGVVVKGCPSVEIYKVDAWEGILSQKNPFDLSSRGNDSVNTRQKSPFDISYIYKDSEYCGYLRFINGDIDNAIHRLKNSFVGTFKFDLIFIKDDLNKLKFDNLKILLMNLAPGGALIFSSSTTDSFASIWREIQILFPNFSYLSESDGKTGLILSLSLKCDQRNGQNVKKFTIETKWFEIMKRKRKMNNNINKLPLPICIKNIIRKVTRLESIEP